MIRSAVNALDAILEAWVNGVTVSDEAARLYTRDLMDLAKLVEDSQ